ncbi:MAG: dTDP-4-dehydrorhamnose 3,5-epimerase [Pirellulales bacterium]
MNVLTGELEGLLILEPRVFEDDRGYFTETYQRVRYEAAGLPPVFLQDNLSRSVRGVLRGLHYQVEHPQGKLIGVVRGEIWDVVVDLRKNSPTFGRWSGVTLSDANHRQLWVPPGLAHGFCVMSDIADVHYKCTDYWYPQHERTLAWNDPTLQIRWPLESPRVSAKDSQGVRFEAASYFE